MIHVKVISRANDRGLPGEKWEVTPERQPKTVGGFKWETFPTKRLAHAYAEGACMGAAIEASAQLSESERDTLERALQFMEDHDEEADVAAIEVAGAAPMRLTGCPELAQ